MRTDKGLLVGIIKHRFQETTKRSLILLRDVTVLFNNLGFLGAYAPSKRTLASQDINDVDAQASYSVEVSRIRVPCTTLIASLGVAIHTTHLGKIILFQVQTDSFCA